MERLGEGLARLERALPVATRRWWEEKARLLESLERRRRAAFTQEGLRGRALALEMLAAALPRLLRERVTSAGATLAGLEGRLERAVHAMLGSRAGALERLELTLAACDPLQPLARGYALLLRENGSVARSVTDFAPGDQVRARLHDGALTARVEATHPDAEKGTRQ